MISPLAGLIAGSLHVVAGPDHLAAVAPFAIKQGKRAAVRVGAAWGAGHGIGVVLVGLVGMGTRHLIDLESVSAWCEFIVGLLLIVIGFWSIRSAFKVVIHSHEHEHDARDVHAHGHIHLGNKNHAENAAHRSHRHAALGVGVLHGAAGGGHLFGVIPSLALPPPEAALFLGGYLISAIITMALFGLLLGHLAARRQPRILKAMMATTGFAAVCIGAVWIALCPLVAG